MEQSHETTIGSDSIQEYESHTVSILFATATLLVATLSVYLVFFDGAAFF